MNLKTCLFGIVNVLFFIGTTSACLQKNISCNDIKSADGYRFPYPCTGASGIYVQRNEIQIARAMLKNQTFNYPEGGQVVRMDNDSVVTKDCGDVEIRCIFLSENNIKETCKDFKTEKPDDPDPNHSRSRITIGVPCGVIGLLLLIGVIVWVYFCQKKKRNEIPPPDRGSGENENEQVNTLESVHVPSLDSDLSNGGTQPNGDTRALDVNGASNHRAVNGLTDDPGGMDGNQGEDIVVIEEAHSGCALGEPGPEDHENEGQPLLSTQGAAIQDSDMRGEAVALVYKPDFDKPGLNVLYSTTGLTDVESCGTTDDY